MTCLWVIAVLVMEIAISFSSFSCLLVFSDLGLIPDLVEGLFPWSEPLYSRSTWRFKGFISFRLPRLGLFWDLFFYPPQSFSGDFLFLWSSHVCFCWVVSRVASASLEDLEGLVRSSFPLFRKEYVSGWFHSMISCPSVHSSQGSSFLFPLCVLLQEVLQTIVRPTFLPCLVRKVFFSWLVLPFSGSWIVSLRYALSFNPFFLYFKLLQICLFFEGMFLVVGLYLNPCASILLAIVGYRYFGCESLPISLQVPGFHQGFPLFPVGGFESFL